MRRSRCSLLGRAGAPIVQVQYKQKEDQEKCAPAQVMAEDGGGGGRIALVLKWVQGDAVRAMLGAGDAERAGYTAVLRVLSTFYGGESAKHPLAPAQPPARARMHAAATKVWRPPSLRGAARPCSRVFPAQGPSSLRRTCGQLRVHACARCTRAPCAASGFRGERRRCLNRQVREHRRDRRRLVVQGLRPRARTHAHPQCPARPCGHDAVGWGSS